MSRPLLSILTPSLPERREQLKTLTWDIGDSAGRDWATAYQHLVMIDNRQMSIGEKRQALVRSATGLFVAFVDDDDAIHPEYVSTLCRAIQGASDTIDVITFRQGSSYNGQKSEVHFSLRGENGPYVVDGITMRGAWHVCAWRRSLAEQYPFPATNYGEDWAWARHLNAEAREEIHIPNILHYYTHSAATTAAPEPNTTKEAH